MRIDPLEFKEIYLLLKQLLQVSYFSLPRMKSDLLIIYIPFNFLKYLP